MLPEYHKGQLCIHKFLLCQEGFCLDCAIHYQYQPLQRLATKESNSKKLAKISPERQLVTSR
jgi:hypothetical protein